MPIAAVAQVSVPPQKTIRVFHDGAHANCRVLWWPPCQLPWYFVVASMPTTFFELASMPIAAAAAAVL